MAVQKNWRFLKSINFFFKVKKLQNFVLIVVHVDDIQWSDQTVCGIITVLHHYSHQVTQPLTWSLSSFLQRKFNSSLVTDCLSKERNLVFVQMEERVLP